jgi:uncharacterized protein (DUF2164 family)
MSIKLLDEKEKKIIESIKLYLEENMDLKIGDLKAGLLLDYILKEIGPVVYNQALEDAQKYMMEKLNELDSSLYKPEFIYWQGHKKK